MKRLDPTRQLNYGIDDKPAHKSEMQIQGECVKWYKNTYRDLSGLLINVHNNAVDEVKGGIAKSLGREEGASDLVWFSPHGVLCIEMKDHKGTQSKAQRNWEKDVTLAGYNYLICRNLRYFKYIVTAWLKSKGRLDIKAAYETWNLLCEKHGIDKLTGEKQ